MGLINQYAKLVANKPILILIISLIFTGAMIYGLMNLETIDIDYEDLLPDDTEVIMAMDIVKNEFGGAENVLIIIKIDSSFPNSNEPLDIRDPSVIKYIEILSQEAEHVDYVEDVSSISKIIKQLNNGYTPNSLRSIKNILDNNPLARNYISQDKTMALIRIRLNEDARDNTEEIERQLLEMIYKTEKPAGLSVQLAGESIQLNSIKKLINQDMGRTSLFSFIGIMIVLLVLFRSFKNSLLTLTTILFGVVWAIGFVSLIGGGISLVTSGTIAMIMGIGIDFGIQLITRFKQELTNHNKREAMKITINRIFMPITITTLAALIGFRAMSLGDLKIMGEMGTIMSLGIAFCMLAAITIVPSILVLFTKEQKK